MRLSLARVAFVRGPRAPVGHPQRARRPRTGLPMRPCSARLRAARPPSPRALPPSFTPHVEARHMNQNQWRVKMAQQRAPGARLHNPSLESPRESVVRYTPWARAQPFAPTRPCLRRPLNRAKSTSSPHGTMKAPPHRVPHAARADPHPFRARPVVSAEAVSKAPAALCLPALGRAQPHRSPAAAAAHRASKDGLV
jgi:hypothetical protein